MLLIQKKRFQFNKSYVYGSAAFIVGFAAVMAILVHNAPIRVSEAGSGITTETAKKESATNEPAKTTQTNDAPAVVAMPTNTGSQTNRSNNAGTTQTPVTPSAPAITPPVQETPVVPPVVIPEVPEVPVIPPVVSDPPIIDIDLPLPVIPINVEVSL